MTIIFYIFAKDVIDWIDAEEGCIIENQEKKKGTVLNENIFYICDQKNHSFFFRFIVTNNSHNSPVESCPIRAVDNNRK